MATRLKPTRINVDNTPRVGDGASYQNDDNFRWSAGGGDMSYKDFEWVTLTGNSLVIEDISNNITPSSDFTVSAGTVKPGIEYVLRVNTGNTPYTMTLGTGVTNPNSYKTELKPNTVNQFKFIATSTNQLELEGVDSAVVSEINWGEIDGTLSDQTDLQNALDQKLDKVTSTATNPRAYVVNADGSQATLPITDSVTSGAIVRRNGTQITVPATPSTDTDAASKKYVDDQISAATAGAVSDTAYGNSWDGVTGIAPSKNAVYDKISTMDTAISGNTSDISTINGKIPSEASTSNQLADKQYVLNNINSVTAYYITKNAQGDQWATRAELFAATTFYSGGVARTPTKNDYTIVLDDENHDHATTRYIYNNGWEYQYTINETPLTQAQLNALNSGITAGKVSTYDGYATSKQDKLVNQSNIKSINNNSLLGSGNLALNDVKVSSTAPASPTEGMVWYDTTNDQLKVYDGSQWQVTGKEYNAGPGIKIGTYNDYSAMQGPCPEGFHVPSKDEWVALCGILTTTFGMEKKPITMGTYLKMPKAGYRSYSSSGTGQQGGHGRYWSSTPSPTVSNAYYLFFSSVTINPQNYDRYSYGFSVRGFKDSPVIPDSSWTTLYDGSSVATGAGVFRNSSLGLISVSGDGTTWYTIMDKNLGATTVFNQGDTLTDDNCGKYYQWGNNYGFPRTGTISNTSTDQIDASDYGPGNYYYSETFINYDGNWDSSNNNDLWGGQTGVVTLNNAITNTGVLSVNGQTGNVTIEAFQLAPNSPLTPKYRRYGTQAQYEALTQYYTDEAGDTVYFTI